MTEHELQNRIRVALSDYGIVFRTNAGSFWQGRRQWSTEFKAEVLINLSRIDGLPKGFPDLIFFGNDGNCAFIEVKNEKGRVSKEQKEFIARLQAMGHRAGVARSTEDAIKIVKGEL